MDDGREQTPVLTEISVSPVEIWLSGLFMLCFVSLSFHV